MGICRSFSVLSSSAILVIALLAVGVGAASAALPECTVLGTEADDEWDGSTFVSTDVVCGLEGDDAINGTFTGTFIGGPGMDFVEENRGIVYGGAGDDVVLFNRKVGVFHGGGGIDVVLFNSGAFRGGSHRDGVFENRGTFHGQAGSDRVEDNFGLFRGGDGNDKVRTNRRSGTFYGGPGFDTVKVNKGKFFPGPQ
jgi:hypothetical protein